MHKKFGRIEVYDIESRLNQLFKLKATAEVKIWKLKVNLNIPVLALQ